MPQDKLTPGELTEALRLYARNPGGMLYTGDAEQAAAYLDALQEMRARYGAWLDDPDGSSPTLADRIGLILSTIPGAR